MQGIGKNDTNIVVAVTVFFAVMILVGGLLSDIVIALLDPRVRVT